MKAAALLSAVLWIVVGLIGFVVTHDMELNLGWWMVAVFYGAGVGIVSYLATCRKFRADIQEEKTGRLQASQWGQGLESLVKTTKRDLGASETMRSDCEHALREMDAFLTREMGPGYDRSAFTHKTQQILKRLTPIQRKQRPSESRFGERPSAMHPGVGGDELLIAHQMSMNQILLNTDNTTLNERFGIKESAQPKPWEGSNGVGDHDGDRPLSTTHHHSDPSPISSPSPSYDSPSSSD